jgi:hypothetical protein
MPLPPPGIEGERGSASLNAAARHVGSALGIARAKTRQLKAQSALLQKRLTVGRTQMHDDVRTAAAGWKRIGEQQAARLRSGARQLADEKPLYIIAGVAAAAFVLGFTLQIRRLNHARR